MMVDRNHGVPHCFNTHRLGIVSCCLVASAFGPYLLPGLGLRLDHAVIYGLCIAFFIMDMPFFFTMRFNHALLWLTLSFFAVAIWTLVSTFFGGHPKLSWNLVLASLDNFTQPMAIIGIMAFITAEKQERVLSDALQKVSLTMCILLSLNTVIAACQMFWDMWPVAHFFLRSMDERTVWENAVIQGRYCGIFDQPVENGLAYSVALVSWTYYVNQYRSSWQWLLLPFLIIGGILSASKVFLFGGIPAGILYFLFCKKLHFGTLFKVFLGLSGVAIIAIEFADQWIGISFLELMTDPGYLASDPIGVYTAGRFGKEGWILTQVERILRSDPVCGIGLGTSDVLDNAYLEFFTQGGIVALAWYIFILGIIGRSGIQGIVKNSKYGLVMLLLWLMIVAAGFGGPVLTMNRSSILLLVFICLIIVLIEREYPTPRVISAHGPNVRNQPQRELLRITAERT
ncbi:hypothetical protein Desti_5313 [Desulfomonile tiedjei DSM 6799]|uniref:O-Antigen ligase n=1 Tax=Desulfomonile tiedjei (strain ATCC 49306 / DSM 6799 / DCB-1) TaxID=706587 RepID=I4CEB1_DESTA|nr:hypothetical protein Desti_5313 [Desulfomonile tiedjei DSM 6799]